MQRLYHSQHRMMQHSLDNFLLIGIIVGPFGVRGQVKLKTITDQPEHLETAIQTIYVRPHSRHPKPTLPVAYNLLKASLHKPGLMILTLKGITTRTAGEHLRQAEVFIHEDDSLPLDDDEYFIHELYTMQVVTVEGSIIGQVYDVLETGANNVLVVRRDGDSDALIPMTHEVVQQIDRTAGRLIIQPLEGLFP